MLKISQLVVAAALMLVTLVFIVPNDTADAASVTLAMPQGEAYVPGRLMVKLKQSEVAAEGLILPEGVNVVGEIAAVGVQIVETDPAQMAEVYAHLHGHPAVEAVELDYVTWTAGMTDDPYLNSGEQWAPVKIQAPDAWDHATGDDLIIAIVDSGIDPNHPDLQGKFVPGYNYVDYNTDTSDGCGHGTHVAGIAAAVANNGIGIAGIAPDAKLMPVKVVSNYCGGSYSRTINGITYAVENGADIIVITSGGSTYSILLENAVNYAREHGVLVVAAAGNSNTDTPFYPASHLNAFAVSGTTSTDARYSLSNYGNQIDVAAPAHSIYSTFVSSGNSTYAYMSGTSAAAPHVAGVAALVWAKNPHFSVAQVEDAIRASADDLGEPGWDVYFGAGRVNALSALGASQPAEPTATPTEVPPTATPTQVPPTATPTEIPPTATPTAVPPTATPTEVPPTAVPPTATPTEVPPTATPTQVPPTATPTSAPQTVSANGMYVSMVDVTVEKRPTTTRVTAQINVAGANNAAVNRATVNVEWRGAYRGSASCTTNAQGRCSVQTPYFSWNSGDVELAIRQMTHSRLRYEPAADREPSPIIIRQPQSMRVPLAASTDNGLVTLFWPASTQSTQSGVMVYRSDDDNLEHATRLTERPIAGSVDGGVVYQDTGVSPGKTYNYWLVPVRDGEEWGDIALVGITVGVPVGVVPVDRPDVVLSNTIFLPMVNR